MKHAPVKLSGLEVSVDPNHRSTKGTLCTHITSPSTLVYTLCEDVIYILLHLYDFYLYTLHDIVTSCIVFKLERLLMPIRDCSKLYRSTVLHMATMAFEFANAAFIGQFLGTIGGKMR